MKLAFTLWQSKLAEKRQTDWRRDMRAKMKLVRGKRESKIRKDAWAKWRQGYKSHLSDLHYNERLVLRIWVKWKGKVAGAQQLEGVAEDFDTMREGRALDKAWEKWRWTLDLKRREGLMVEQVGLRLMAAALQTWKQRMYEIDFFSITSELTSFLFSVEAQIADDFYKVVCLRQAMRMWKDAQNRLRVRFPRYLYCYGSLIR
jgi:protein SFI1